ncbi:MAG: hypothetical protein WKG07_45455 [Hymenobacter sp.]
MLPSAAGGTAAAPIILNKEGIPLGKALAYTIVTALLDNLYYVLMVPLVVVLAGKALYPHDLESAFVETLRVLFVVSYVAVSAYAGATALCLVREPVVGAAAVGAAHVAAGGAAVSAAGLRVWAGHRAGLGAAARRGLALLVAGLPEHGVRVDGPLRGYRLPHRRLRAYGRPTNSCSFLPATSLTRWCCCWPSRPAARASRRAHSLFSSATSLARRP